MNREWKNIPTDRKLSDREYAEMIYSLLSEMNGSLVGQMRATNNNLASFQRVVLGLKESLDLLVVSQNERSNKRYEEELTHLEVQYEALKKIIEEKKVMKDAPLTTSQEIRTVALDTIRKEEEEKKKKYAIDWIDLRNKFIYALIIGLGIAIVNYLLPGLGQLIQDIFTK